MTVLRGLSVVVLFSSLSAFAGETVIYGQDNRRDTFEVTDPGTLQRADSTVMLVHREQISMVGATPANPRATAVAQIRGTSFATAHKLCRTERFFDQPIAGFCSGALIAPDLVLTAGHCVTDMADCQGTNFVFGYKMGGPGRYPGAVAAAEVYGCRTIVARKLDQRMNPNGMEPIYGADFAIIQLDRAVTGHRPLPVSMTATPIAIGTPLVLIGYPSGLPQKIENGGKVRSGANREYFMATTDSYQGNSGSPVFSGVSGEIVGVLVRGDKDFVPTSAGCMVSKKCAENECKGEAITRSSEFAGLLQNRQR